LVLIWAAVRPLLNKATGDIQSSGDCLVLDVEAVSCVKRDAGQIGTPNYMINVTVSRGATEGDLTGVRFIFSDGTNSQAVDDTNIPLALQTRLYSDIDLNTFSPTEVNVAAIVGEQSKVCNPLSEPIVCS